MLLESFFVEILVGMVGFLITSYIIYRVSIDTFLFMIILNVCGIALTTCSMYFNHELTFYCIILNIIFACVFFATLVGKKAEKKEFEPQKWANTHSSIKEKEYKIITKNPIIQTQAKDTQAKDMYYDISLKNKELLTAILKELNA